MNLRGVTAFRNASLAKARLVAVFMVSGNGIDDESELSTALFAADISHFRKWRRPIWGETWVRTHDGVHGVLLAAAIGDMIASSLFARDASGCLSLSKQTMFDEFLSPSDMEELRAAGRDVRTADLERVSAFGGMAVGAALDWVSLLPDAASVDDLLLLSEHCVF